MANIDTLNTIKTNILNTLATITASPKPSYSLDGQSISWTEYHQMLLGQLAAINDLIIQEQPFIFVTQGRP